MDTSRPKPVCQPKDLARELNIGIRAIQRHLASLEKERRVEKRKEEGHRREYRATDSYQVSKEGFARIMRPMSHMMIYSINRKPRITIKEIENSMTRKSLEKLPPRLVTPQLVAAHSLFPSPLFELDKQDVNSMKKCLKVMLPYQRTTLIIRNSFM